MRFHLTQSFTVRRYSPTALRKALMRITHPLVRLMIAQGITLSELLVMLKHVYVDVAKREFFIGDRSITASRISILTGVHRKDVAAILKKPEYNREQISQPSIVASVIARWVGSPDFADANAEPRPLFRRSSGDDSATSQNQPATFDDLVEQVNRDVRPRTILDELKQRRAVVQSPDDGAIMLLKEAYAKGNDPDSNLHYFEANLHDHIGAATFNIQNDSDKSGYLDQALFVDNLSPQAVEELQTLAREHGIASLRAVAARAAELQKTESEHDPADHDPAANIRFRFGLYTFDAPQDRTESVEQQSPKSRTDDQ